MESDWWLIWNIEDCGSSNGVVYEIDFSEALNIVKIIKMKIPYCFCFEYLISD